MKFEDIELGKVYIDNWNGVYYTAAIYSIWKAWLFKAHGNRAIISYMWVTNTMNLCNLKLADNAAQLLYGFKFKDE